MAQLKLRAPPRPVVLIVEDDAWMGTIAGELLEYEGFAVVTAADGRAGLAMAERLKPAVIVLDLGLPLVSGGELLRRLRARPKLRKTPVIVVSGHAGRLPDAILEQVAAALRKPIDVTELIERVHEAVGQQPVLASGKADGKADGWTRP